MTPPQVVEISAKPATSNKQRNWPLAVGWILTVIIMSYGVGTVFGARLQIWPLSELVSLIYHSTWALVGVAMWVVLFIYLASRSRRPGLVISQLFFGLCVLAVGAIWNLSASYEPIKSTWHNGSSYHLMFATDGTDFATYDVLKCDILGLRCDQIFRSENYYNQDGSIPREDAHFVWNEAEQKISFVLNNETVFTENSY